jgi:putative ABC transport system permease protein
VDRYLTDLRSSLRSLLRSPGLTISAVAALAMGIGFTTTMFSIVHGGTRQLPFEKPRELVVVAKYSPSRGPRDILVDDFDYVEWSRQQRQFSGLAAFDARSVNLGGDARHPERRSAAMITPNTLDLLGARPLLGRGLLMEDGVEGAAPVVVLGFDLWRSRFDADSAVVGRVVRVNGEPRTVVGVMPPKFGFPIHSDLWMPLTVDAGARPGRGPGSLTVVGRLRDGTSLEAARAEMATIADRLAQQYPETHGSLSARVYPFVDLEMEPSMARALYLMVGVVSFVLLIACANVASLLLARAAARSRDTAIRTALGASRRRIVTQHLIESGTLAVVGGLLGLGLAHVAIGYFDRSTSGIIEAFWMEFKLDGTVLAFASGLVMLAGIVAGLVPALRSTTPDVAETLKDAGTGSTGLRIGRLARSLVVVELALATGFLIMTMTFTKSALALRAVSFPFPAHRIFTGQIGFPAETLGSVERRQRAADDILGRVEAVPGVAAAALVSRLPGRGAGAWSVSVDAPAREAQRAPTTGLVLVTPDFFRVLGTTALRGRLLSPRDGPQAPPVAVVNESWVRRFSPDRDPVGRRVWFGNTAMDVVGVVPDLQMQDPEDHDADGVYAPLSQRIQPYALRLMARTTANPLALTAPIRDAVESVDPDLPMFEIATLYSAIYADKKVLDVFGLLFALFGAGALFMTTLGLYAVVSFAVSRRTREIGIRVALGAAPRQVVALVLRQGAGLIGIGAGAGLVIAFMLSKALAAGIDAIDPAGPITYVAIAGTLVTAALLGLLRPVLRALALEPGVALRPE